MNLTHSLVVLTLLCGRAHGYTWAPQNVPDPVAAGLRAAKALASHPDNFMGCRSRRVMIGVWSYQCLFIHFMGAHTKFCANWGLASVSVGIFLLPR